MIEVKFEARDVIGALGNLSDDIVRDVTRDAVHPMLDRVKNVAKIVHRFKRRTGTLQRSIRVLKRVRGGTVMQDGKIADYGYWVHEGHGTWAPDRFFTNAWERNQNYFDGLVDKALRRALRKAGFR